MPNPRKLKKKHDILKGHLARISGVQVDEYFIYSASQDGTVKVWDKKSKDLVTTLGKYSSLYFAVAFQKYEGSGIQLDLTLDNDHIYSSEQGNHPQYHINMWEKGTWKLVEKYYVEDFAPDPITVDGDYLYSGNFYGQLAPNISISIWKKSTEKPISTLKGPKTCVFSLNVDKLFIYGGYENGNLTIWDKNTKKLIKSFQAYKFAGVGTIQTDENLIYTAPKFSSRYPDLVRMWDINTYKLKGSLPGTEGYSAVPICVNDGIIYIGHPDGSIKLFDQKTKSWLEHWDAHLSCVNSIFVDNESVYTGSDDGTVRIFSK